MGATTFEVMVEGKSAKEAFDAAVQTARYERGHSPYAGGIASKTEFTLIAVPRGTTPAAHIQELIETEDARIDDKWGPAGCIDLGGGKFIFFGWAPS
jgi:hypothetical protein